MFTASDVHLLLPTFPFALSSFALWRPAIQVIWASHSPCILYIGLEVLGTYHSTMEWC